MQSQHSERYILFLTAFYKGMAVEGWDRELSMVSKSRTALPFHGSLQILQAFVVLHLERYRLSPRMAQKRSSKATPSGLVSQELAEPRDATSVFT